MSKASGADRALVASDGAASVSTLSGFDHGERLDPRALLEGTTPGPWAVLAPDAFDISLNGECFDDGRGPSSWVSIGSDEAPDEFALVVVDVNYPNQWDGVLLDANAALAAAAPQLALTCISQEERIAELEAALASITHLRPFGDIDTAKNTRKLVMQMERLALDVLAKPRTALTNTGDA